MEQNSSIYSNIINDPQITFLKNTYRRHTEFITIKKIYESDNYIYKLTCDDQLNAITHIWIHNCSNIKNVFMYLADDMEIIHRMSINSLRSINKIMFSRIGDILELPINELAFVPSLAKKIANKCFVIEIDPVNQSIVEAQKTFIYHYLIMS